MSKLIIITGATGFVGKNLKSYLKEEYDVKGVSRNVDESDLIFGYEAVGALLSEAVAFVHLAGKAHDLKNTANDAEYFEVNTDLTKVLFDKFLKSECKIFIYMSSVKAVKDSINEVLSEDTLPEPITAYGRSKLKAEEYILMQSLPDGKAVYILRPCMIHGPGNKGNLNLLYNFVSKGLPYPLASFENKRSYLSVENLCFIISELLSQQNLPSGIYNVADDEALSTTEVVSLLSQALDRPARNIKVPKPFIVFLARIGDVFKLPVNTERLGKLTENYMVSNQKIKKALKKELPLTAREGILKTAKTFKNPSA